MLNSLDSLLLMILTANPTSTLERSSEAVFFFYDYDLDLLLLLLHGRLQLPSMKLRKAYKLNRTDSIVHSGPIQRTRSSCGSKKPYNSYANKLAAITDILLRRPRVCLSFCEVSVLLPIDGRFACVYKYCAPTTSPTEDAVNRFKYIVHVRLAHSDGCFPSTSTDVALLTRQADNVAHLMRCKER